MRASDAGLSTTTTSSGLFDEARTRPHVPSSTVTRTPFTVALITRLWSSSKPGMSRTTSVAGIASFARIATPLYVFCPMKSA